MSGTRFVAHSGGTEASRLAVIGLVLALVAASPSLSFAEKETPSEQHAPPVMVLQPAAPSRRESSELNREPVKRNPAPMKTPVRVQKAPARLMKTPTVPWDRNDSSTWPLITGFSPSACILPGAALTVRGERFGSRGKNGLELSVRPAPVTRESHTPTVVKEISSWTDADVSFTFPRAAGMNPGVPVSVEFSFQGRRVADKAIEICRDPREAKVKGLSLEPAAREIVASPQPHAVATLTPVTAKTLAGATTAHRSRGVVYRVRYNAMARQLPVVNRIVPLQVVRNFDLPETRDVPPSSTPSGPAPIEGDIDPLPDARPSAAGCPEGDPNCPDIPPPVDGAVDPPEWRVSVGSGCPPGKPGCGFAIVSIWPDGDPVPDGNPKDIDCSQAPLGGIKLCEYLIPDRPDILGDPVPGTSEGDEDAEEKKADEETEPDCTGKKKTDEGCGECKADKDGNCEDQSTDDESQPDEPQDQGPQHDAHKEDGKYSDPHSTAEIENKCRTKNGCGNVEVTYFGDKKDKTAAQGVAEAYWATGSDKSMSGECTYVATRTNGTDKWQYVFVCK